MGLPNLQIGKYYRIKNKPGFNLYKEKEDYDRRINDPLVILKEVIEFFVVDIFIDKFPIGFTSQNVYYELAQVLILEQELSGWLFVGSDSIDRDIEEIFI